MAMKNMNLNSEFAAFWGVKEMKMKTQMIAEVDVAMIPLRGYFRRLTI